ncbi:MAG: aldehyde dehydrogenase family protein, partial [Alphaproteobacteria bacterium]|nr:aldehyde dehydrogenase family protein [Alphaproteobacteria bacterium]
WNSAAALMIIKLTPALLAGCTVIIKASPEAPLGGYLLMEIIEELGLPPGTVNFVTAERASSEHLVRHPGVDKITFTGSTVAGKRIASICGERLARCTLELGGKSAAVVLDDYQVDQVAATLAQSTAFMTNQVCAALSRVVVSKYRHDEMVDALADAFRKIKVGDPYDPASNMGPLAMRRQLDRVCDYIDKGKADGARLATGGGRPAGLNRGYYIEPTVFANVDPNSTIAQEEIFGPVVAVIAAEDEADAIRIANGTQFGLNASIFTNDVDRAQALARELRSGNVGHNAFRVDFGVGFGGVKQSGIGREGGPDGLRAYLESKTVLLRRSA